MIQVRIRRSCRFAIASIGSSGMSKKSFSEDEEPLRRGYTGDLLEAIIRCVRPADHLAARRLRRVVDVDVDVVAIVVFFVSRVASEMSQVRLLAHRHTFPLLVIHEAVVFPYPHCFVYE